MRGLRRSVVLISALVIATVLTLSGCAADSGVIDNDRLLELQAEGARVVDVRTPGEFAAGFIPGAARVPLQGLSVAAGSWDKAEPIVVYCAVGDRSGEAAQILRSIGFERVYDLSAGIAAWDGEVARGANAVTGEPPADSGVLASGLPVAYEFYTDW
jgi:rhodanese-related sulfurtransferase